MKDKKEKYYTPDISEFHVGFEYEMKATFGDGTVKIQQEYDNAEWQKQVYSLRSFPYVDRTMTGRNSITLPPAIRVKYLDKEDVESLGFKFFNLNMFKMPAYIEESLKAYITQISTHEYSIRTSKNSFNGIVRNKSELKILLRQLQILIT